MTKSQARTILNNLHDNLGDGPCPIAFAKKLLKKFGLKVDPTMSAVEYVNKTMNPTDPEIWVHNLHHYLVAPPKRRLLPEFGLGTPEAAYVRKQLKPRISEEAAEQEEDLVSALDFIVAVENNYELYSIDPYMVSPEMIQELYKRNLITLKGKPTFYLSKK